jgi:hypothetical protein
MENKGDYLEATVRLPKLSLVRYQYSVPAYDYDHREQFKQHWEVNRYVFADADKVIADEAYDFGHNTISRPATLHGRVVDQNGDPILEAVVVADGILALTVDGYYRLQVRDREFPLTVFTLDGSYKTQSKLVQPGQQDFTLIKAAPIRVTLNASASPPQHHQVRLYASASQFGARLLIGNVLSRDSFVTLNGPLDVDLYEGQWVDYLYSVGSPVISYEHGQGSTWVVRSLLAKDGLVINDTIGSFVGDKTVTLTVDVPAYTGPDDVIGIEGIHPTPLFMHKLDADTWTLILSNYDTLGTRPRYYKAFPGVGSETRTDRVVTSPNMHDTVAEWWSQDAPIPQYDFNVPSIDSKFQIYGYPADFYSSFHDQFLEQQIRRFKDLGYHGIVLTDAWGGYVTLEPTPRIVPQEPLPVYMPVHEMIKWTKLAHDLGLEVMITPQLGGAEHILATGKEFDEAWWRAWLVEIERLNMHMARASQAAGVDYLHFHAKEPGFLMPRSFIPEYNDGLIDIIEKMLSVYHGQIIVGYEEFVEDVDYHNFGELIIQVSYELHMTTTTPTQAEVDAVVSNLFDQRYQKQYEATGKPLWIILGYQSVDGAVTNFFAPEHDGPHTPQNHNYPLDLDEQRMIYEAFYKAAASREWIEGFALFGYGFTNAPLARDVTVNGKPAEALSSAWAKSLEQD